MTKFVTTIMFALLLMLYCKATAQDIEVTRATVKDIASSFPGMVGICMVSDSGDTISFNENLHFPLISVMKFHQALVVYKKYRENNALFGKTIHIRARDIMENTWSPMRDRNPRGGKYTIAELLKLSLAESDNNACNILFKKFAGMNEVNDFIHSIGIGDCCISADEKDMAKDFNACYSNWSSPKAATDLLEWFYENKKSFNYIWDTMAECKTGEKRIPRYLKGATIVHKTGTGPKLPDGKIMAINDIACIVLPNNHHYSIAIFIENAECKLEKCEELIANISRLCYEYIITR